MTATAGVESLTGHLRTLKLPSFALHREDVAAHAEQEGWTYERFLYELAELEIQDRHVRRIERLQRQSKLPSDKTPETLDVAPLPAKVRRQVQTLYEGRFVEVKDGRVPLTIAPLSAMMVECVR